MKKILMLMAVFLVITIVPQDAFTQTDVEPAKQEVKIEKQVPVKKEMKEKALPSKKEGATSTTAEPKKQNAGNTPPATKEGEQPKSQNNSVPSKAKPREAVIAPIKNPKNNKVTLGRKIDKKD